MKMVLYAIVTGDPVPSFSPWPLPSEEGGGVVLPCNFIIYSSPVFIQNYNNQISDLIKDIPEDDVLQVHMSVKQWILLCISILNDIYMRYDINSYVGMLCYVDECSFFPIPVYDGLLN